MASVEATRGTESEMTFTLPSDLFVNLAAGLDQLSLSDLTPSRMVACFMIDGSDRYTAMTINAINSFLRSTPHVDAGVLVPPTWSESVCATRVVSQLSAPERVRLKVWSQHFEQWNPTQYKLDILQFADEYDVVLWLDSDTIVYNDLRPLLQTFHKSSAKYMFVRDHVSYNEEFLGNWPFRYRVGGVFVPQACFMAFKSEHMRRLFSRWESIWSQWIDPEPFYNFADPLPSFAGSRFCIEQYALGHTIDVAEIDDRDILELTRSTIALNTRNPDQVSHAAPTSRTDSVDSAARLEAQGSTPAQQTDKPQNRSLVNAPSISSYSHGTMSRNLTSYPTSYSSSYVSGSSRGYNRSVTYFDSSTTVLPSHRSTTDPAAQFPDLPEQIFADNFGGCVVHFYSTFYDVAHQWWVANEDTITTTLKTRT